MDFESGKLVKVCSIRSPTNVSITDAVQNSSSQCMQQFASPVARKGRAAHPHTYHSKPRFCSVLRHFLLLAGWLPIFVNTVAKFHVPVWRETVEVCPSGRPKLKPSSFVQVQFDTEAAIVGWLLQLHLQLQLQ
eukprot:gene11343-3377_t